MPKNTMTSLSRTFEARLLEGALPGELEGFDEAERAEAAAFVAEAAGVRPPATPRIVLATFVDRAERRRMRLAVINDDMPFLVDSISQAIAAHDIAIHRLLHPVIAVERDAKGTLASIGEGRRESMVYIEMDRADLRERRALVADLERTLEQVRDAVEDWPQLRAAMTADAAITPSAEGAALLSWFERGAMTLLGHERWRTGGATSDQLGISRYTHAAPILAEPSRQAAVEWFQGGGEAPLLLKVELHLDRPPPRAARSWSCCRSAPAAKVDRHRRSMPACGPAPRCSPIRPRRAGAARPAEGAGEANSASIRRATPARRCATR